MALFEIDLSRVEAHGVVGAGGAGFPTHVKLKTSGLDTVIVNAAECEPLLHKDKELLKAHPDALIEALAAVIRHTGASRGIVAIKAKNKDIVRSIATKIKPPLSVHPLDDFYPAGDEVTLVYAVTGRLIPPAQLPLSVGVVVSNVETLLNVVWDCPVTEKFLTVAGAVRHPVTLRVPVGTSFAECVASAGGANVDGPVAVLDGGALMGGLVLTLDRPVTKTTGGLIVLPIDHDLVQRRLRPQKIVDSIGRSACDQCSFCTELCPRFILGHPIEPHLAMRNLGFHEAGERMVAGTQFCCGCNLCTLYSCPENLDPKNACVESKARLRGQGRFWSKEEISSRAWPAHPMEPHRHVPIQKLILKIGLRRFANQGPMNPDPVRPGTVKIPLQQHLGVPSVPVVKSGDRVVAGQTIGTIPVGKLGATVHASLSGVVRAVEPGSVVIDA